MKAFAKSFEIFLYFKAGKTCSIKRQNCNNSDLLSVEIIELKAVFPTLGIPSMNTTLEKVL